jgi:uncharacterized protein YjbI with pentapeptide repeats
VRQYSPWQGTPKVAARTNPKGSQTDPCPKATPAYEDLVKMQTLGVRKPDVQSALTVLARLDGVQLDLQETDLRLAFLPGEVNFRKAILNGTTLEGVSFDLATLDEVSLGGGGAYCPALLNWTSFWRASMRKADLEEAKLIGAFLLSADLRDANLMHADLAEADLGYANLKGARLDGANLRGAKANDSTQWPDGFDWKAAGVVESE